MNTNQPCSAFRLRIITAEAHRIESRPAHEFIMHAAFEHDLAGATVSRGLAGFGRSHRLHTAKFVDLSDDLPMIIEIIDDRPKIESFVEFIRSHYAKGVITLDEITCWR